MLLGSPDSSANKMPIGEPITAAAAPMTIANSSTTPPAPSRANSVAAACRAVRASSTLMALIRERNRACNRVAAAFWGAVVPGNVGLSMRIGVVILVAAR